MFVAAAWPPLPHRLVKNRLRRVRRRHLSIVRCRGIRRVRKALDLRKHLINRQTDVHITLQRIATAAIGDAIQALGQTTNV